MHLNPMPLGQFVVRPYSKSTPPPERPSSCTDFEKIRLLAEERVESPTLRYKRVIQENRKVCDLRAQAIKQKNDEPLEEKKEKVLSCCERIWAIVESHIEYSGRYPMSYPSDVCMSIHLMSLRR